MAENKAVIGNLIRNSGLKPRALGALTLTATLTLVGCGGGNQSPGISDYANGFTDGNYFAVGCYDGFDVGAISKEPLKDESGKILETTIKVGCQETEGRELLPPVFAHQSNKLEGLDLSNGANGVLQVGGYHDSVSISSHEAVTFNTRNAAGFLEVTVHGMAPRFQIDKVPTTEAVNDDVSDPVVP